MPFFAGTTGQVHFRSWPAGTDGPAWCDLVLVHGRGQHSALYHHVARRMAAAGIAVYGLDLPGHGLSEGEQEPSDPVSAAGDLRLLADSAGRPRVALGHSLGATTVIADLLAGGRWDAVVLCGTPVRAATPEALDRLEQTGALFVHGADDRMTPLDPLLDAIGDRAVTVEVFPDAGHDLFHEPVERQVTARVIEFLREALPGE